MYQKKTIDKDLIGKIFQLFFHNKINGCNQIKNNKALKQT
ncbi:hypothetical protein HMPREF1564_2809 [Providencia alcalifaciens R90-1475]|nr:hypothetical protein HMPREF1564_2809 [Providencia alcalifaciens R90-1475]